MTTVCTEKGIHCRTDIIPFSTL